MTQREKKTLKIGNEKKNRWIYEPRLQILSVFSELKVLSEQIIISRDTAFQYSISVPGKVTGLHITSFGSVHQIQLFFNKYWEWKTLDSGHLRLILLGWHKIIERFLISLNVYIASCVWCPFLRNTSFMQKLYFSLWTRRFWGKKPKQQETDVLFQNKMYCCTFMIKWRQAGVGTEWRSNRENVD